MASNSALRQSVRWSEEYVSRALNIKFAGILRPGVYHGYNLFPGGNMTVAVRHDADYPRSVAIVERDGYSLTVLMDDETSVQIPAPGSWYICIEAFYAPTQIGYQHLVARETPEKHHVILGKVTVSGSGNVAITQAMINTDCRQLGTISADPDALILEDGGLDIVDEKIYLRPPLSKTWNIQADIAANGLLQFPTGATYKVGINPVSVYWLGLKLARGKDYQETGAAGSASSSVKLLFAASSGDEFQAEIYK